ncbi:MAG: ThuA domain-containing protein [Candidatus Hydrogenedentes bacterium]|nr:ThuA domain-containing protein [Candidatus Hydrogenedentota bacterium]
MAEGIRVTVWNEGVHEKGNARVRQVYPKGMGWQIAHYLKKQPRIARVRVAELSDPEQGLSEAALKQTDVMTWWGHKAHDKVLDKFVDRVHARVLDGMGLVVLHSGHYSKIFKRLMGTTCSLKWREWQDVGEKERLWVVDPAHPIAEGLPEYFELPNTEMYGEHFDIPAPEQLVLISWFQGGEVFRSGCCWHRGKGKIFYFRPGHETFPIYHNDLALKVIYNGIRWTAPTPATGPLRRTNIPVPLEPLDQ